MQFLNGLTNFLLQLGQALIGPFGLALITVAIAGTVIACLVFHAPFHFLWRAILLSLFLVVAGVISSGIAQFAGG